MDLYSLLDIPPVTAGSMACDPPLYTCAMIPRNAAFAKLCDRHRDPTNGSLMHTFEACLAVHRTAPSMRHRWAGRKRHAKCVMVPGPHD